METVRLVAVVPRCAVTVTFPSYPAGLGDALTNRAGVFLPTATVSGLTRNYSISAEFSGDAEYAPAKATTALGVAAGVTQSLSGYYTSTRAGNGVYRVYHHNAAMRVSTTVAPGKAGQCVEWQVDRYYGGAWHAYATSHCSLLSKASTDSFRVPLGPDGQYKIRVNYIASAGAAGNVSGSSSWQGFTVTN